MCDRSMYSDTLSDVHGSFIVGLVLMSNSVLGSSGATPSVLSCKHVVLSLRCCHLVNQLAWGYKRAGQDSLSLTSSFHTV